MRHTAYGSAFDPTFTPTPSLINHNFLVIDESYSMDDHAGSVVKAVDAHVAYLASLSKDLNQETRVTVYTFAGRGELRCLFYDIDVLRMPSIDGMYSPRGNTALAEATLVSIEELGQTAQLHGDHSFLGFVFTDGWENNSTPAQRAQLPVTLASLAENWTVGVFVPDIRGVHAAKQNGFPASNIAQWDTTSATGFEDAAGSTMRAASENFMRGRATGVRGFSKGGLFRLDVSAGEVQSVVPEIDFTDYKIYDVRLGGQIRDVAQQLTGFPYITGSAYYQLTKKETIQPQKAIAIEVNGRVHTGRSARQLLQLPDANVQVGPGHLEGCTIFVQSTSVNRKILPGTRLLVMR
jgi:hypothetical protein